MLPFTPDDLNKAIADGLVTERQHPTLPLYIFNYSPEVQYTNRWNDVTLNCRGLILDEDNNIVARPWKKFFNLGQVDLPIQFDTPVEVMDKADGSLGILYPTPDGYSIATRGSFESEQAIHATKVWNERYSHLDPQEVMPDYTFLFEIVYPSNRIVLDYDGMDDLILLGAVDNLTGYYISPLAAAATIEWPGPVVEVYPHKSISEALGAMGRKNKEGYVIRSHNFMVKVKEPDYLELHRLVTNVSPKTVWEQLKAGKTKTQIISNFPDEFHSYVESMIDPLIEKFKARSVEIHDTYYEVIRNVPAFSQRKEYAKVFTKHKESKYLFLMLDNKSIRDVLWAELKPRETKES